jgi:hypothetical protein
MEMLNSIIGMLQKEKKRKKKLYNVKRGWGRKLSPTTSVTTCLVFFLPSWLVSKFEPT